MALFKALGALMDLKTFTFLLWLMRFGWAERNIPLVLKKIIAFREQEIILHFYHQKVQCKSGVGNPFEKLAFL